MLIEFQIKKPVDFLKFICFYYIMMRLIKRLNDNN